MAAKKTTKTSKPSKPATKTTKGTQYVAAPVLAQDTSSWLHCSCCGRPVDWDDAADNDGYSSCCNEPVE